MTPKSLLRHPLVISTMEDLAGGAFQEVIDDTIDPKKVKRVILCSGKFYYDLLEERENRGDKTTAIIRLEQLYPLRQGAITEITKKYKHLDAFVWAQEEPANSGAWTYLLWQFPYKLKLASPPASAAPAPGSYKIAAKRHAAAIELAFKS
jgi:2-oxoglutarate dehydrogenase E1 component